MILSPFLTDLDSRAAVKGSRDPLGIQPVWTRFGRHVVGNLTTVSTSVRDFTTLLLGYYFAAKVAERNGPNTVLTTFLKWEQLAAYSRGKVNGDWAFRGTERVRERLRPDQSNIITLSAATKDQILSNQKLYGLWGLYSVPARASGLLEGEPARLTPVAADFVESFYLPMLGDEGFRDGKAIVELLTKQTRRDGKTHDEFSLNTGGGDKRLLAAVARLLRPRLLDKEQKFYREHLIDGGPEDDTRGQQKLLVELLEPKLRTGEFEWSPPAVAGLAKEAEKRGDEVWLSLAGHLRRIGQVETVTGPASMLFTHLLGCDGKKVAEIEDRIRRAWGTSVNSVAVDALPDLQAELGNGDPALGQRWVNIGKAMHGGEYGQLMRLLLEQNRAVMQARGGAAAWVEEQNKRFKVRMNEERGNLPSRKELPTLWRSPYFLNALAAVTFQLKEESHD